MMSFDVSNILIMAPTYASYNLFNDVSCDTYYMMHLSIFHVMHLIMYYVISNVSSDRDGILNYEVCKNKAYNHIT